jgi:aminoglycoside phosphotransferase family enzyme
MLFLHFSVEQPKAKESTYFCWSMSISFVFLFKNRAKKKKKPANLKVLSLSFCVVGKNKK